ncbi:MAG: AAA domain-containing protein [Azospirillum sp.]|nr:AAA domain-containing protein [Azospirillum sp.]
MSNTPDPAVNLFLDLKPGGEVVLPAGDRFPPAGHLWRQEEIYALILAWAARRPLLVRGEAGSGKSQIARAAAFHLYQGEPLVEVIHPRFEALDLLYRMDVVARLADAQTSGALDPSNAKYVKRGKLWQAMAPDSVSGDGAAPVLLVDEIDKADAEVPNALLEVLGNRSFSVPPLGDKLVSLAKGRRPPLIVITTNEERELPAAFVRRCVVLNLSPPADEPGLTFWLVARGRVHRHLQIAEAARLHAARQVVEDRGAAVTSGYPPVGLAEYIDLLTALDELTRGVAAERRAAEQIGWLDRIGAYALVKHPGRAQDRQPVARQAGGDTPA